VFLLMRQIALMKKLVASFAVVLGTDGASSELPQTDLACPVSSAVPPQADRVVTSETSPHVIALVDARTCRLSDSVVELKQTNSLKLASLSGSTDPAWLMTNPELALPRVLGVVDDGRVVCLYPRVSRIILHSLGGDDSDRFVTIEDPISRALTECSRVQACLFRRDTVFITGRSYYGALSSSGLAVNFDNGQVDLIDQPKRAASSLVRGGYVALWCEGGTTAWFDGDGVQLLRGSQGDRKTIIPEGRSVAPSLLCASGASDGAFSVVTKSIAKDEKYLCYLTVLALDGTSIFEVSLPREIGLNISSVARIGCWWLLCSEAGVFAIDAQSQTCAKTNVAGGAARVWSDAPMRVAMWRPGGLVVEWYATTQ